MNSFESWQDGKKFFILLTAASLLFFVGYWFCIVPMHDRYSHEKIKEQNLRAEFAKKYREVANLEVYREHLSVLQQEFNERSKILTAPYNNQDFLEELTRLAKHSSMRIEQFNPQKEMKRAFYFELTVHIQVRGSYQQLTLFVNQMIQNSRLMNLRDFVIKTVQPFQQEELLADLLITSYRV